MRDKIEQHGFMVWMYVIGIYCLYKSWKEDPASVGNKFPDKVQYNLSKCEERLKEMKDCIDELMKTTDDCNKELELYEGGKRSLEILKQMAKGVKQ